jgi:hypothetical protein
MARARLLLPVVAAALAAPGTAAAKGMALVVQPGSVRPGDHVTVATPCAPAGWRLPPLPAGPRYDVLLARGAVDGPRVLLGRFRADLENHGRARFTVPKLAPGAYRILVGFDDNLFASTGFPECGRAIDETLVVREAGRSDRSPAGLIGLVAALALAAVRALRVLI